MSIRAQLHLLCHCCGLFEAPSFQSFCHIFALCMLMIRISRLNCTLEGCCRTFTRFQTYRNHVYTYHKNAFKSNPPNVVPSESQESDNSEDPSVVRDFYQEDNSAYDDQGESSEVQGDDLALIDPQAEKQAVQRAAALWILKARECYRIPLSSMDAIIQDLDSMYGYVLSGLQEAVTSCLQQSDVDSATIDQVKAIFSARERLFIGLDTQYLQMRYFQHHFQLVMPQEVVLGTKWKPKGSGAKRRMVEQKESMVYIPLMETLQRLLENEAVLAEIEHGHQSESGVLGDYCDGEHFRCHLLYTVHINGLQLLFYYDDIEVVNPLGSKRSIHALGMFYFVLGNIRTKYRAKLRNIHLLAVVKKQYVKKYTLNVVLQPMIEDIKKLELGYQFQVCGSTRKYYGTVASVCADNPASSAIGGFKKGGRAHRGCRQCLGTTEELCSKFHERDFVLRTLATHREHLAKIESDDSEEDYSKLYGVNERSVFMELKFFDICSGSLIADIIHDLLEGAVQLEAKLLLKYLVLEKQYLSAHSLEHHFEVCELGYMEAADRPTSITVRTLRSKGNAVDQKAGQMLLLSRLLPVLFGHCVPEGDEYWENYLLMVKICSLVFAPTITKDEVGNLEWLIQQHHEEFSRLYPDTNITPKMHYMVHMPRLISQFGPLVHHWTMRFEAKHNYFKKLAARLGNFINIAYTLAVRHQCLSCYYSLDKNSLGDDQPEIGPGTVVVASELLPPGVMDGTTRMHRAKWVRINGILYKKCSALVTGACPMRDVPTFGEIDEIVVINNAVHFILGELEVVKFAEHYNAYVTRRLSTITLFSYDDLVHPHPMHLRTVNGLTTPGQKAIVLKYNISSM